MPLLPEVHHRTITAHGVDVAYRESVPAADVGAPPLLLLHGFPSGAHAFRRLIDALGDRYQLIAPDLPGFGMTGVEGLADRPWTFAWLTDVLEAFLGSLGVAEFVAYVVDWGGPLGFRLAERQPDAFTGLIIQNANAYVEGLSPAAQDFISLEPTDPGAEDQVRALLTEGATRRQYLTGVRDASSVSPESWFLDQSYLDRGERTAAQVRLAFDYKSNLDRYPQWQNWLATRRPPTVIAWGRHDPFFTVDGALAYLRDVPDADLHLLDTGHFALEEKAPTIAMIVDAFLQRL